MADDPLQQLEDRLQETERKDLVMALAEARRALRDAPTASTIAAYKATRQALQQLDAAAAASAQSAPAAASASWPNLSQVGDYLVNAGWKITKKTLYQHGKLGKLRPRPDNHYHQPDVDQYAAIHLKRADGQYEPGLVTELQQRLLEADLRYKEARAESAELKNQLRSGAFLPRDTVEAGLAARAHRLKAGLLTFIKAEAPALVHLVHGDDALIPDAIAHLTDRLLDHLHAYSQPAAWEAEPTP